MTEYPKAVIWDLDGTLVDSAADIAATLNRLLAAHGLAAHSLGRVKTMIGGGIAKLIERGWAAHDETLSADAVAHLTARFMTAYSDHATDETRLYDGVRETLELLHARGVIQAVCTNKPRGISELILERLGVADAFQAVIGGDSTREKKPHPLPVLICLRRLAVTPGEAVMVGDSGVDLAAGHAAGLPVVLLRQGYSPLPLDGLGAEAVIDGVSELPGALALVRSAA